MEASLEEESDIIRISALKGLLLKGLLYLVESKVEGTKRRSREASERAITEGLVRNFMGTM